MGLLTDTEAREWMDRAIAAEARAERLWSDLQAEVDRSLAAEREATRLRTLLSTKEEK